MAKKVRVYELAREYGITNKEALDLCLALGIGVKSHSSSIEEAQADRVRRKADAQGLKKTEVISEVKLETAPAEGSDSRSLARSTTRSSPRKTIDDETSQSPSSSLKSSSSGRRSTKSTDGSIDLPTGERTVRSSNQGSSARGSTRAGSAAGKSIASQEDIDTSEADGIEVPSPQDIQEGAFARKVEQADDSVRKLPRTSEDDATQPDLSGGLSEDIVVKDGKSEHDIQGIEAQIEVAESTPTGRPSAQNRLAGGTGPTDKSQPGPRSSVDRPQPGPRSSVDRPQPGPRSSAGDAPKSRKPDDGLSQRSAPGPSRHPMSSSGRPIPPPPGRPLSPSGKAIPPPPGARGPRSGDARSGDARSGNFRSAGPSGQNRPNGERTGTGSYAMRRSTAGSGGPPRGPSSFTGQGSQSSPGSARPPMRPGSVASSGGMPSAPPRGSGPPSRGRPGQQRSKSKRRRRNIEELEPTQISSAYVPSSAPVPEGEIIVERGTTAQVLGPKLNRTSGDVIRFLLLQGEMITATQSLSDEMIELFAAEIGASVKLVDAGEEQEALLVAKYFDEDDEEGVKVPRPPIVTVMGHVDHGKTTLLDVIRNASVAQGEAGGITQHIGAYRVSHHGKSITFIDTPGHEAFTAMRARGAQVTDVIVLVVAANDGVMPQTVEAISHAKVAGVPILVAITKVDRPDADPNRVMQQLSEHDLVPESWGGNTVTISVAAPSGIGVDDLLENILLIAELEELEAVETGSAKGVVLEANLDIGKGPVATLIVQRGQLQMGDIVVAGPAWGKVKALIGDGGALVKSASPSDPVVILGLSTVPSPGDEFRVVPDQSTARAIAESREQRIRAKSHSPISSQARSTRLEDLFEQVSRGEIATLNLILKSDVHGSMEALTDSLKKLEREEVKISFVHRAVGAITENDVSLAAASGSTIIGFNVRPDRRSRDAAEAQKVEIRTYEVVYKVLEDIEAALVGMLKPEFEEIVTGEAQVREVFRVPRIGPVAGCYVRSGTITRGSKVRFLRDGVIIWKGTISSLRRFKDDVREVQSGFECGIGLSDFQDLKDGDLIETFEEREMARS